MTRFGYAGEILKVDLSDRKVIRLPSANYIDRFLGGRGLAARLYWESVPPQTGALEPENCLIYASGPVAGFPGFAGSRWKICGKSPAGGREAFSYANLGGKWGTALKYAGYDGLAVQGRADTPVYLFVTNDTIIIRDASALWGKSTFDAVALLKAELGKEVSVLAIGPAAENLVPYATILADEGASGSGGLGAVMGSKKLKAIVVVGDKKPIAADPERLRRLAARVRQMRQEITTINMPWAIPGVTRRRSCYGCGMGCARHSYSNNKGQRFKSLCQASMFYIKPLMKYFGKWNEVQLHAARLCDGYGLDTSVLQGLIELLDSCYHNGLLQDEETGLPLSRIGSVEFIEELTRKISLKEGFGSLLARGTTEVARAIGPKAVAMLHNCIATRADETKDYDPRMILTTALFYATEPRRPIQQLHEVSQLLMIWLNWIRKDKDAFFSTEDFLRAAELFWGGAVAADFSTIAGKALAAKKIQDRTYAKESLVLCDPKWPMTWAYYEGGHVGDSTLESQIVSAITGAEIDEARLNKAGERIFNLQRALLLRQGWEGRKDDRLLDYFHEQPLREGEIFFNQNALVPGKNGEAVSRIGAVVNRAEFETMKSDYYQLRGWDIASGLPTKRCLEDLQLDDVASDLANRGLLK